LYLTIYEQVARLAKKGVEKKRGMGIHLDEMPKYSPENGRASR